MVNRIVCWFSCGAASAVATKLAIADNAGRRPLVIAYTEVMQEHPDNRRFLSDCERWFGQEIKVLRDEKYSGDIMQVFRGERFIVGPYGAPCTRLLKRWPRIMFEDETDTQVFGFTSEEVGRAERFRKANDYMDLSVPLIDRNMAKADCQALLWAEGIKLPVMYELGYRNNNCIGCVKGGKGYWNKIRVDFPDRFAEMAALEREIGASVIHDDHGPVYLDELPRDAGRHEELPDIECGVFCQIARGEIANDNGQRGEVAA